MDGWSGHILCGRPFVGYTAQSSDCWAVLGVIEARLRVLSSIFLPNMYYHDKSVDRHGAKVAEDV